MVVTRDPEVLFKEARRRTRRRRMLAAGFVALSAAVATLVVLIASGAFATQAAPGGRSGPASSGGPTVPLKSPNALAAGPSGTLYVVDPTRNQVLTLRPSGKFAVFAGDGRQGFSGDGGPATRAELRLDGNAAVTVARDGTVYIPDPGNNRVRAVAPDGTIRTIVRVSSPTGLAIRPHDQMYIGASDLYRLSLANGRLTRLAGWDADRKAPITQHQILEGYFSPTQGVAVDRSGDVFAISFPGIFERTAAGALRCMGSYRAAGAAAQLTAGPGGALYGAALGIFRLRASALDARGSCDGGRPLLADRSTQVVSDRTIVRVDHALGWHYLAIARPPLLSPAGGLAVSSDGTVYYDTQSNNGWVSDGALVEITPRQRVRVLWRATH